MEGWRDVLDTLDAVAVCSVVYAVAVCSVRGR